MIALSVLCVLQEDFCLTRAKVASASIPMDREGRIAEPTVQTGLRKEEGVIGFAQPQRRLGVSCLARTLVKKPSGSDIADRKQLIAAGHERQTLSSGSAWLRRPR